MAGPYPPGFTALTRAVFHGNEFLRKVPPDYLSFLHTFLKSHLIFLTDLRGLFCGNSQVEVSEHRAGNWIKSYY